ncbi:MAG: hypothetical protein COA47_09980 [Robiginitomaculum sp.]|nr:MAG: hypothetical protein COA47_09980 [Robiginitomaculum sp.]
MSSKGFDWKALVGSVAPVLGTVLAGGNPLGGMALKALAGALTGDEDAPVEVLQDMMARAKPEDLHKVKEVEQSFLLEMENLGITRDQIIMQDKSDARKREIATGDNMPAILAGVLSVMVSLIVLLIAFGGLEQNALNVVLPISGAITTAWVGAMQYYFGTTKTSNDKNKWKIK